MLFIDGAYLAKNLRDMFQGEKWDFSLEQLVTALMNMAASPMQPDLIRIYYYDAIPDDDPNSLEGVRKRLLENFQQSDNYQLRTGRLKESRKLTEPGKRKQKGVDVLLAIEMLSKAYENHYDTAILLSGDDDFLDLVEAIKDTGKRVVGVFFRPTISQDLHDAFDKCIFLEKESLLETKIVTIRS